MVLRCNCLQTSLRKAVGNRGLIQATRTCAFWLQRASLKPAHPAVAVETPIDSGAARVNLRIQPFPAALELRAFLLQQLAQH